MMNLFESSGMDSVVENLCQRAGGLFIYAKMLDKHLQELKDQGKEIDFKDLNTLPRGMDDIYMRNFERVFPKGVGWDQTKDLICMIVAAKEPLPEHLAQQVGLCSSEPIVMMLVCHHLFGCRFWVTTQ